jgi:hypothetical protein
MPHEDALRRGRPPSKLKSKPVYVRTSHEWNYSPHGSLLKAEAFTTSVIDNSHPID